ncbi:MAG: DUF4625 domain-containing protein [Paludibacteraceae bacterium]
MLLVILSIFSLNFCENNEDIDKEKPTIDLTTTNAFPLNCDTLYFGESFNLKVRFVDNAELGSVRAFSIDIHNNFDHHSHSTEVAECSFDPIQSPVNPFTFIEDFDVPAGVKEYRTNLSISIPSEDKTGLYDEGDYHFFIRLTDKSGWSTQKGLSIKILHR